MTRTFRVKKNHPRKPAQEGINLIVKAPCSTFCCSHVCCSASPSSFRFSRDSKFTLPRLFSFSFR